MNTFQSCRHGVDQYPSTDVSNVPENLFKGLAGVDVGIVSCGISLATNVLATLLVALKAWFVLT